MGRPLQDSDGILANGGLRIDFLLISPAQLGCDLTALSKNQIDPGCRKPRSQCSPGCRYYSYSDECPGWLPPTKETTQGRSHLYSRLDYISHDKLLQGLDQCQSSKIWGVLNKFYFPMPHNVPPRNAPSRFFQIP